jgi:hypothetical protein
LELAGQRNPNPHRKNCRLYSQRYINAKPRNGAFTYGMGCFYSSWGWWGELFASLGLTDLWASFERMAARLRHCPRVRSKPYKSQQSLHEAIHPTTPPLPNTQAQAWKANPQVQNRKGKTKCRYRFRFSNQTARISCRLIWRNKSVTVGVFLYRFGLRSNLWG